MPEAGYIPIPRHLARPGVNDMVRISDARMSGTAFGTVVLHVTPEAAAGGPLAVVRTGDRIRLDVPARRLDLLVDADEIAARLAALPGRSPGARLCPALRPARPAGRRGGGLRLPPAAMAENSAAAPLCLPPRPLDRPPRVALPPGTCDCHFHVFRDGLPLAARARLHATHGDARRLARPRRPTIGIWRGIVVQPASVYGTDNRALLEALAAHPDTPARRRRRSPRHRPRRGRPPARCRRARRPDQPS